LFIFIIEQTWGDYRYEIAEPEKAIIDYLYLHPDLNDPEDFEALRWNSIEIKNQISMEKLSTYEAYIDSPALSRRLKILKTFLDVITA